MFGRDIHNERGEISNTVNAARPPRGCNMLRQAYKGKARPRIFRPLHACDDLKYRVVVYNRRLVLSVEKAVKTIKPFLTKRQIEVLKLRMKGLTQDRVAEILKTTRENIANLENRAYINIMRARITLKLLDELNPQNEVVIPAGTLLTDVPRIILDRADMLGIKILFGAESIYQYVKKKARRRGDHLTAPLRVKIFPSGRIKLIM